MNDSEKVLVEVVGSGVDYLVPAKLVRERSAWFGAKLSQREGVDSIVFEIGNAFTFKSVLLFMCTGLLPMSLRLRNQLDAALEIAMVANKLKMEDLEWCAVGRLEEYFESNKSTHVSHIAIECVLHSTETTSYLRAWLAGHVAGCLSTGTICAGALDRLITTAPDFATMIMMEMQRTTIEVTNALLDTDIIEIENARREVMPGSNYAAGSETDEPMRSSEDESEEAEEDSERDEEDISRETSTEPSVTEDEYSDEMEDEQRTEDDEDSDEAEDEQSTEDSEESCEL